MPNTRRPTNYSMTSSRSSQVALISQARLKTNLSTRLNKSCKSALAIFILTLLNGCNQAPNCPTEIHSKTAISAGCLVIENRRLLVAKAHNGLVSIPGGSANAKEPSHCAAHRETWEETGLNVRPQKLLRVFDNGFHLYRCGWDGKQETKDSAPFFLEIDQVLWIGEEDFGAYEWRFPEQADWLLQQLKKEP